MFSSFYQETKNLQDSVHTYLLATKTRVSEYTSDYSLVGKEVIVT